jgi:hypothetical protein
MRRRFGRRRSAGASDARARALDVGAWLERLRTEERLGLRELVAVDADEVPPSLAVAAIAADDAGERVVVSAAPNGGDAALAALAVAGRLSAEEGFRGLARALAPRWSVACQRRLAWIAEDLPFTLRTEVAPELAEPEARVVPPQPPAGWQGLRAEDLASALPSAADRDLFARAGQALAGLAAKHGGVARASARGVERVLVARRVAVLRVDSRGVELEALVPSRQSQRLESRELGEAFDRLEGNLRKHLSDRAARDSEEGQRARWLPLLTQAAGLERALLWPLADGDTEVLDVAGVGPGGRVGVGALRRVIGLEQVGPILDALAEIQPGLGQLLDPARSGLRLSPPRLLLVAERFEASALCALAHLALEVGAFDVVDSSLRGPGLRARDPLSRAAASASRTPIAPARSAEPRPPARAVSTPEPPREPAPAREEREREVAAAPPGPPPRRFQELSTFDLEEEPEPQGAGEGPSRRRRQRGRRRGRGRRSDRAGEAAAEGEPAAAEERAAPAREARQPRGRPERAEAPRPRAPEAEEAVEEEEEVDAFSLLSDEEEALDLAVPELPEILEPAEPAYEDDGEEGAEEGEDEAAAAVRREREARRRARLAEVEAPPPRPPRRRAAFVAHADRESLVAAVLLARDLRLIEGIWVYPQSELMTFFRGVATDLREDTPIVLVGFTASPARETLQTASLYRGRLSWYDHHAWPPEDLVGLQGAIGAESVHVAPGVGSALPVVLEHCTRRSRFSDKLVDLVTGRFTEHDFERWGRVWWARLGEAVRTPGERRQLLEPLLVGRPSDLARQAASGAPPPLPAEVGHVASRDFRIVHFGGYGLVVVPVPPGLDVHLTARIARERYAARLSLAYAEGQEVALLGSDDGSGRRALDLVAMVEHLAAKLAWVDALSDADHVARFRIRELALHPERIDEVVGEIAMSRSVLEG